MITDPGLIAWMFPLAPDILLTEAMVVSEEVQATEVVRFWVELSEYTPIALNASRVPFGWVGLAGVTVIDTRVAGVTVSAVDPDTEPKVAVTVVDPAIRAVATPS
jgi:hypothetical protein